MLRAFIATVPSACCCAWPTSWAVTAIDATDWRDATSCDSPTSRVRGSKRSERSPGTTLNVTPAPTPPCLANAGPETSRSPTWTPDNPALFATWLQRANVLRM